VGSLGRGVKRLSVVEQRNCHRLLLAICTETIDMIYRIYTVSPKKQASLIFDITSPSVEIFLQFLKHLVQD